MALATTFEQLPNSLIRQIALALSTEDIENLCHTNERLDIVICRDKKFWYDKLVRDYGVTEKFSRAADWRKIYKYYQYYKYRLIGLGVNVECKLGLGYRVDLVNELTHIPTIAFKDVACNDYSTIIIDYNGDLWGTGCDSEYGNLGIKGKQTFTFSKLKLKHKFVQVSCRGSNSMALTENNKILMMGSNSHGQLGSEFNRYRIGQVTGFFKLKKYESKYVACGDRHSAFIDLNNKLYTFGDNGNGQLGREGRNSKPTMVPIPGDIPIIQVSCGHYHTACIDANNDIWTFGFNHRGHSSNENTRS